MFIYEMNNFVAFEHYLFKQQLWYKFNRKREKATLWEVTYSDNLLKCPPKVFSTFQRQCQWNLWSILGLGIIWILSKCWHRLTRTCVCDAARRIPRHVIRHATWAVHYGLSYNIPRRHYSKSSVREFPGFSISSMIFLNFTWLSSNSVSARLQLSLFPD